jgi:glutathione synthase/RimK-type ligase-like ATP-grasp enzyme
LARNSSLAGKRIGFATMDTLPELHQADQLAAEALRAEGALVDPLVWTDESVRWHEYDVIVIRSTWDYHLKAGEFMRWLDTIEKSGAKVFNPLSIVRWNLDKHYLLDLKARNIEIPRTLMIERGKTLDYEKVRGTFSGDEVVIKPSVSASAWETRRISLSEPSSQDREWIAALHSQKSLIVQEYMPEIIKEGEWSFLFFGPEFSHAVVKRPASGDFRVQEEWGGTYSLERAPEGLVEQAVEVIRTIKDPLLYARIDAVARKERLYLMELELVEPALYFDVNPASAKAFCERLADILV